MVFDQLSNFKYCRLPELDEIEDMFDPRKGLFENTKENQVALFNFIFYHLDFNLEKLEALPKELTGKLIETY